MTISLPGKIKRFSEFVFAAAAMYLCGAQSAIADPVLQQTDLQFRTTGQSLFFDGGNAIRTENLGFDILNQQETQLQKGRIVNSQVPLSVATLQAIWQRAVNTCTSKSYSSPLGNVSPTQNECITGSISRQYCEVPLKFGWSSCLSVFRKTYTRNIGAGIGPKPTKPTKRPYDFGAIVTMSSDIQLGFQGFYSYDLGSVDVDYSARATLNFSTDNANAGDIVTIQTSFTDQSPYVMTSRYPSFELGLDMYAYARLAVDAEYAGVNESNGDQVRTTRELYAIDTRDNPDAIDGFVPFTNGTEPLFGVRLDTAGFTTSILGVENTIAARYEYNMTYPFNSPDVPAKKAPKYKLPVSFSLADFAFTVPQLDTPAPFGFDCGDCVPARNEVTNGALTNTTPVGLRQLIGGITDGNGIVLPFVDDGAQDVDLARIDVDLDVVTVAAGVPLGVVIADPVGVLSAELNLLDLDLATFLSVDQSLEFRPMLEVELRFSTATEVRLVGQTDFASATSVTVPVGETVEYRQPSSALTVTPIYSIKNNNFKNLTQLKISNAIQETLGQVKLGGYVGDNLAEVLGEDPNFALLQLTPTLYDPAVIWSTIDDSWSLDGFADQPAIPVLVSITGSTGASGGTGGTGGAGGTGVTAGTGGSAGGSGGGATGLLDFAILFCVITVFRRARSRNW